MKFDKLNIVRGDLKNKPVSSSLLSKYFDAIKDKYEGTLYIGYPIIGTTQGGFQIDALLVTREKGVVIFNIIEGKELPVNYQEIQDECYTKLSSKLIQHKGLTNKRSLVVEISPVTFAPAYQNTRNIDIDYPVIHDEEGLYSFLDKIEWAYNEYFEELVSVLQTITSIRRGRSRDYVRKVDSRGAKLKKLEDSIANLDQRQSSAVIETVDGVQRIRGLAGSGKTIILALKVAYLHAKNPEWKIAVTFNTRALKGQFKKLITQFTYENINDEPNWDNIDIIHAWGTTSSEGIYFNLCKEHNVEYLDFSSAQYASPGKEFEYVCEKAMKQISQYKAKYDLIVVDEAQDFSNSFLRICYNLLKSPKRLVYAYDELQSLNTKQMQSPEGIFGNDSSGKPIVSLENKADKPKEDIILYKCYRNSLEVLTSAHALGFGIFRNQLVQMFDNSSLWNDIGYEVVGGKLGDGQMVELSRDEETSPQFLSEHSPIDDLLIFKDFRDNNEQVDYVVNEIVKNIREEELKLDDIIVINPDPYTTKKVVGVFRDKLFQKGINSSLAGVSSSPDIFYTDDAITFTGIYRAKGNEAAMVYIINAQYCYTGSDLAKKRNILFTAMTRSKAWVRVCGYGEAMKELKKEYLVVKNNTFKLNFRYPTAEEREHMNIVNRDMSTHEKNKIEKSSKNLKELFDDIINGKIQKEDLPKELREKLKKLL